MSDDISVIIEIYHVYRCRQCGEVFRASDETGTEIERSKLSDYIESLPPGIDRKTFFHDCSHGECKTIGVADFAGMRTYPD